MPLKDAGTREMLLAAVTDTAAAIESLLSNNPTLYAPMKDDHVIDISLAALLLLVREHDR